MANKQPFYHRAVLLFTATREVTGSELATALKSNGGKLPTGIIKASVEVEECDAEPGDPADLL